MLKECNIRAVSQAKRENPSAVFIEVTRKAGHILSPSWDLLMPYKRSRITWDEYVRRFYAQMDNPTCREEMKRILEMAKSKDVYLVCFCDGRDGHCHRFLLIELIGKVTI